MSRALRLPGSVSSWARPCGRVSHACADAVALPCASACTFWGRKRLCSVCYVQLSS